MTKPQREALDLVQRAGVSNQFTISAHASARMRTRGATRADVREALTTANCCEASRDDSECWLVTGTDLDDEPLVCVVTVVAGVHVVTVRGA